jgi:hypothetical protein
VAVTGTTALNDNQWHHLVAVRDDGANRNRLYVDGVKVDSASYDYTAGFGAATAVGIGFMAYNANPDYFYDGLLDEIAFYDRALTDAEIMAHYTSAMVGQGYCAEINLTVNTVGDGTVARLPDQSSYFYGDTVVVTAMADSGWVFQAWSDGLTGSENPDTLVLFGDTTVTATFIGGPYTLATTVEGNGLVTLDPDLSSYLYGDTVIVTAVPDTGWAFHEWTLGLSGNENPDTVVMVSDTTVTGVFHKIPTGTDVPPPVKVLTLRQNVPNPFTQGTYFEYGLPRITDVTFEIFDIAGRRVYTKHLPGVRAGWNRFQFDGNDSDGRRLPSGIYFYRLKTPQATQTKKMVIVK